MFKNEVANGGMYFHSAKGNVCSLILSITPQVVLKRKIIYFSCCLSLPLCSFTFYGIEFHELSRIKVSVGLTVFIFSVSNVDGTPLLRFSFLLQRITRLEMYVVM